ncbi:MAG: hypothetical protein RTS72_01135 [Candidatus Thorarchaeota archaeon]
MNKRYVLIILITLMFITPVVTARNQTSNLNLSASSTHDIMIEALSSKSFPVTCTAGDTLSGEFRLVSSGDLFPGDQTKYDNWLLDGIDFIVLDHENYGLWVVGSNSELILQRVSIIELKWSIEIPHNGVWYVVYSNDSLFMHQIEGSIIHTGPNDTLILLVGLIGIAALLILTGIYRVKK